MFKNILVVAPHADDEILGCGATIYKMMQEGHNVYVLIMTNASKSDPNIFSEKG
ncbi:PIG-L family deacetylase, partial [Parabacteroides distasonis]